MGLLDWFINRPAQFDPDVPSEDVLANKQRDYPDQSTSETRRWLSGKNAGTGDALRRLPAQDAGGSPAEIEVSAANWSAMPVLHAFFARPEDLSSACSYSRNLRTFFDKYPGSWTRLVSFSE